MTKDSLAVLQTRKMPSLFINFADNITPDCDCCHWSDAPICPDLGVFVSDDSVAVDQACIDMVCEAPVIPSAIKRLPDDYRKGECKFCAIHPHVVKDMGLEYAEQLGLGSRKYKLVKISSISYEVGGETC